MIYRKYPVSCTENTRDLGGYPTQDGGVTKFGMFIRSDAWINAPEEDIEFIKKAGVTTVVDLRTEDQAAAHPHSLSAENGFDYHNVPVLGGGSIPTSLAEYPITYMEMADGSQYVCEVFRVFAAARGPVLFNCAAGKDRTGVISGLLLEICGVSDTDIFVDYMLSAEYMHDNIIRHAPIEHFDPDVVTPNRKNWEIFIDMFRRKYASARDYLLAAGLKKEELDSILKRFVAYP